MCNFKVGQRVVAIVSGKTLVKGTIYTIMHICSCACGGVAFDVGRYRPNMNKTKCSICGVLFPGQMGWFSHSLFRPLDELSDQVERIEKEGCPQELIEELTKSLELATN